MSKVLSHERVALLIVTLQEAFAATLPFFLLTSIIALLRFLFGYFHWQVRTEFFFLNKYQLWQLLETFNRFASFVATATIAYFFARRINVSPVIATMLSIATLISYFEMEDRLHLLKLPYGFAPVALFNPLVSTFALRALSPYLSLSLPETGGKGHMYRHLNHLFTFVAAYMVTMAVLRFSAWAFAPCCLFLKEAFQHLSALLYFAMRDFLAQLLWFVGVHGDRLVNGLMGREILKAEIAPHLTFAEFNRLFVVIGGSGVGLALFLALLVRARERSLRLLALVSAPFVVFNINTLLIYALVVFNRFLFFPFVFLPLFNLAAGYAFLRWVPVRFSKVFLEWNTPPFLDGYLKSGGDLRLVAFQGLLVAVDTLVYVYFVQRYSQAISLEWQLKRLGQNLRLTEALASRAGIKAFVAYAKLIEAHAKLESLVRDLREENLEVFYQPVLPARPSGEYGLEALLRYRDRGEIRGPEFLDLIEDAGLASLVDLWVCKRVKRDLEAMRRQGRVPRVSINLHPDTFLSDETVSLIIQTLKGEAVTFEIVERSFLAGERAQANLQRLRQAGFAISVDDFGSGYSSLDTIIKYPFYELKLDRNLVETVESPKGRLVTESIVKICHQIGARVVAEGVETEGQRNGVCAIGVDRVQGYFFAPALPLSEALRYLERTGPGCPEA